MGQPGWATVATTASGERRRRCPLLSLAEGSERGLRPDKNFIAVFCPQLTKVDIYGTSAPGNEAVYYVKELTPFIVDNQGPLSQPFKPKAFS